MNDSGIDGSNDSGIDSSNDGGNDGGLFTAVLNKFSGLFLLEAVSLSHLLRMRKSKPSDYFLMLQPEMIIKLNDLLIFTFKQ